MCKLIPSQTVIGNIFAKLLAKGLEKPRLIEITTVKMASITYCNLIYLNHFLFLQANDNLRELHLNHNEIGDKTMATMSSALGR